jgi:hypothetical protein
MVHASDMLLFLANNGCLEFIENRIRIEKMDIGHTKESTTR